MRREVIGQFGEGLKVGTLALVREGRSVTLETGQEHWLFELVQDPNFGEKVLTVLVTGDDSSCNDEYLKLNVRGATFPTFCDFPLIIMIFSAF